MPELPEVETVRQVLLPIIKGRSITQIEVLKERIIQGDVAVFIHQLTGRKFIDIERIGKYLIFFFDHDLVMVSHLRMEGKYIEIQPDGEISRFARVIFTLDDGRRLCYDDSRQFGTMEITTKETYKKLVSLSKLGPEPFEAKVDEVYARFQKTTRTIKEVLLDQTIMTGLGNIYVDEVLFLSKIHPETMANLLSKKQTKDIINHAIHVLNLAIKAGGSTIRTYHAGNGVTGDFQIKLNAYNREYLPCNVCGHKMKKIFVGGRGSTYCPHCQINPSRPLCVAITGLIGAGKSTVGQYLRTKNYSVIDADEIVKNLYQDHLVTNDLEKHLNRPLHHGKNFDKSLLKNALIEDPKLVKKLENYIHPLVKSRIIDRMKTSQENVLFFEIPLVFSHKINELFAYIIGVETDQATQEKFLLSRGKSVVLSPDLAYKKNRVKLDYIIINNSNLAALYDKVDHVLKQMNLN